MVSGIIQSSPNEVVTVIYARALNTHWKYIGIFISPPNHPNNLISSRVLQRYGFAFDLFCSLKLPIISFLDTCGVDPRGLEKENNIISDLTEIGIKIISYPYPKLGILLNRCYGGASILGFPKIFGSQKVYALQGTRIGIMHDSIISQILNGSPRLLEKWKETSASESKDLSDLTSLGIIDGVITEKEIINKVHEFLDDIQVSS